MGKDLGVLVGSKVPMGQQRARVAKVASGTLGCTGRAMASRWREVIPPLLCPGEAHLECCVQCWAAQFGRDRNYWGGSSRGLQR